MWKTAIVTGVCTIFVGFVTLGYLQKNNLLPDRVYESPSGQSDEGTIQEPKY
jgi:hypothetical protein